MALSSWLPGHYKIIIKADLLYVNKENNHLKVDMTVSRQNVQQTRQSAILYFASPKHEMETHAKLQ